jgi:hypothetical protein
MSDTTAELVRALCAAFGDQPPAWAARPASPRPRPQDLGTRTGRADQRVEAVRMQRRAYTELAALGR